MTENKARYNDVIIIIIMEICKARTLRLKALNKHSITHIMYSEMEMLSKEAEEEEEEEKWPSALWRERSLSLTPRLSE